MPAGYTRIFERMLNHPNIKVLLETDYRDRQNVIPFKIWFSLDRSMSSSIIASAIAVSLTRIRARDPRPKSGFSRSLVINYPNEHDYTRVTEFKHLTGQAHPKTSDRYEYPETRRSLLSGATRREPSAL